jgi:hypothetical protein
MIQWTVSLKAFHGQSLASVNYMGVLKSARAAVGSQIEEFRVANSVPNYGYEIDHKGKDFVVLLREYWMRQHGRDLKTVTKHEMKKHWVQWSMFHKEHAQLQVLSICEHRRLTSIRRSCIPQQDHGHD